MARRTHEEVVADNNRSASLRYDRATASNLWDVYGTCSFAKQKAFRWCENKMHDMNGYGLKIVSHNSNFFTVMFLFADSEDGNIKIQEETAHNSRTYDYI